ncbi:MAG TPA: acyl carrier protein [Sphingomicrobium sp.]|nr:acyl carrier protein [Sphingomicrobium sp.]
MAPIPATHDIYSQQIRDFLVSNFYISKGVVLDDDTSLLDEGIIDSTGVLEVVSFLEETFGIKVDDTELLPENLNSIRGMTHYLSRKKG